MIYLINFRHLANRIGVGYHGSRLAILDGKTAQWDNSQRIMNNQSNIADWGCNFTVNYPGTYPLNKSKNYDSLEFIRLYRSRKTFGQVLT